MLLSAVTTVTTEPIAVTTEPIAVTTEPIAVTASVIQVACNGMAYRYMSLLHTVLILYLYLNKIGYTVV